MKTVLSMFILGLTLLVAGCGPSKAERDAEQRARLEQEETARLETEAANKAITDMNQKMFKKLTPEERAQRDEERKRAAQKLLDEMKQKEADAAKQEP